MNINDWDFKDLRAKLDVMGFNQTLPVLAIPLVGAIFGDLIKTTECLRDTKRQVADLLEVSTGLAIDAIRIGNRHILLGENVLGNGRRALQVRQFPTIGRVQSATFAVPQRPRRLRAAALWYDILVFVNITNYIVYVFCRFGASNT